MPDLDEAKRKLSWCMAKKEIPGVEAKLDADDMERGVYNVSFHKAGKATGVRVPYLWLVFCDPEANRISPEMDGLLREVARISSQVK